MMLEIIEHMICSQELELFDLNDNKTLAFLETLVHISNSYGSVHKYLCLGICIIGCIANSVHLAVLTRPVMRQSAVNRLLSLVAICDILTMLSYTIFTIRFGFAVDLSDPPLGYALHWIVFLLIHVVCSIALHTITLYTSVATAYVRYKALKTVSSKWNRSEAALPIFAVISFFVIALCVPTFLVHDIVKVAETDSGALYTVGLSELSTGNTCFIFKANLWLTGIVFKVIPCLMLFIFTIALLLELDLSKRRRKRLTSGGSLATKKADRKTDRTTHTLILLMTVFIVTELPQGALALLNGMYPNDIHQFVYLSLGELLDLLSLINGNVCWIIYPLMSSVYRDTFKSFIVRARKIISEKAPVKSLLIENTTIRFLDDQDILL